MQSQTVNNTHAITDKRRCAQANIENGRTKIAPNIVVFVSKVQEITYLKICSDMFKNNIIVYLSLIYVPFTIHQKITYNNKHDGAIKTYV